MAVVSDPAPRRHPSEPRYRTRRASGVSVEITFPVPESCSSSRALTPSSFLFHVTVVHIEKIKLKEISLAGDSTEYSFEVGLRNVTRL